MSYDPYRPHDSDPPGEPTAPVVPSAAPGGPYPPPGGSYPPAASPYPPPGASPYGPPPGGGYGPPGGWPGPAAPPPKRRTGLIIGLVAGGLALVLCVPLVIAAVSFQWLRTAERSDSPGPITTEGDPFAGTPAADFETGEIGITLPSPTGAGDFSVSEVDDALLAVKETLVATRLDDRMVRDHDPDRFVTMLADNNQDRIRGAFSGGPFGLFATQIAGGATLTSPQPRVNGTVTFHATEDEQGVRVIEVSTSFVWVYAFEDPGASTGDAGRLVVIRDQLDWHVAHRDDVSSAAQGLWLWRAEAAAWGVDCDEFADASLVSPGVGDGPDGAGIYDPESRLSQPGDCQPDTD